MNLSKNLNYKYHLVNLATNSNYEKYIFNSGLKLSKLDEEINITGEKVSCAIQSSLFINKDCHQEIKTKVNHLKPDSKSFQKIKSVLNNNSKTAYQGKIFVKDIAQKTDAYQLSKALILSDDAEFNAKPELEIYADDVKCSHGSTSGNIDDESIYYLMTRGLSKKDAILLLTEAFLFEVTNSIDNQETKKFVERHLKIKFMNIKSIKSEFPILKKVNNKSLIYLDSANSSQKPKSVINSITNFYENDYSNIGRSVHTLAVKTQINLNKQEIMFKNI